MQHTLICLVIYTPLPEDIMPFRLRRDVNQSTRQVRATLAMLASAVLILTACSTGQDSKSESAKNTDEIQVGAIMYARDLEFWQLVEGGMRAGAKEMGVKLNVEVSNRQLQTEGQLIDTMYARGDNVLLVAPIDATASAANLRRASKRGTTIVQYDSRVTDKEFENFVGVDPAQLGTAIGELTQKYLDENLDGTGKFAVLTGDTESNGPPRRKAFLKAAPGAKVVTTAESVGSPEAGAKAFETVLQSDPDIDAVFAWNGSALQGAATAAQRMNSKVKIFGIDQSKVVATSMMSKSAHVQGVADQQAFNVGYTAVTNGVKAARGDKVETNTSIKPTTYSAGDSDALNKFIDELGGKS